MPRSVVTYRDRYDDINSDKPMIGTCLDCNKRLRIPLYVLEMRNKTGEGDDDEWKDHYELRRQNFVKEG